MFQKTDAGDRVLHQPQLQRHEGLCLSLTAFIVPGWEDCIREKQVVANAGIGKICSKNEGVLSFDYYPSH